MPGKSPFGHGALSLAIRWDTTGSFADSLSPLVLTEPDQQVRGPGVNLAGCRAVVADAEADAVRTFLIDMKIKRNSGTPKRCREFQRVLDLDGIVLPSVPDKTRRRVFGDFFFR